MLSRYLFLFYIVVIVFTNHTAMTGIRWDQRDWMGVNWITWEPGKIPLLHYDDLQCFREDSQYRPKGSTPGTIGHPHTWENYTEIALVFEDHAKFRQRNYLGLTDAYRATRHPDDLFVEIAWLDRINNGEAPCYERDVYLVNREYVIVPGRAMQYRAVKMIPAHSLDQHPDVVVPQRIYRTNPEDLQEHRTLL